MAANRPIAVANSASAMPGATTASDVFFEAAMERNDDMMPHTVPNRPTNGPADATDASTRRLDSSRSTSRAMETSSTFSMRACKPMKDEEAAENDRFHSRMAATNSVAIALVGRSESVA